jgi:hypothetical protein
MPKKAELSKTIVELTLETAQKAKAPIIGPDFQTTLLGGFEIQST